MGYIQTTAVPWSEFLKAVFIDENQVVTNVEEAFVESDVPDNELVRYYSDGNVKWVVEMNIGLSLFYGVGKGTKVNIEFIN